MAYRHKDPAEKIADLEEKQRQISAQLRRERAKVSQAKRKEDTRRKILAGALALEHQDPEFQATMQRLIQEYVTKPGDRALFGLEPLPEG